MCLFFLNVADRSPSSQDWELFVQMHMLASILGTEGLQKDASMKKQEGVPKTCSAFLDLPEI